MRRKIKIEGEGMKEKWDRKKSDIRREKAFIKHTRCSQKVDGHRLD